MTKLWIKISYKIHHVHKRTSDCWEEAQGLGPAGTLSHPPGDRCELAGVFSIVCARLSLNMHPGSPPPVIRVLCHPLPEGGQAPLTPPNQQTEVSVTGSHFLGQGVKDWLPLSWSLSFLAHSLGWSEWLWWTWVARNGLQPTAWEELGLQSKSPWETKSCHTGESGNRPFLSQAWDVCSLDPGREAAKLHGFQTPRSHKTINAVISNCYSCPYILGQFVTQK